MSTTETTAPRHRRLTHVGTGPIGNRLLDLELDPDRTRYHALRRAEGAKSASVRRCGECGAPLLPEDHGPLCPMCELRARTSRRLGLVTRLRAAVDGWWRGKTDGAL